MIMSEGFYNSWITAVYVHRIPKEERTGQINLAKYPIELGITLEFYAGITDKNLSNEETAKAEVLEETGYEVPVEKFEKVKAYWYFTMIR